MKSTKITCLTSLTIALIIHLLLGTSVARSASTYERERVSTPGDILPPAQIEPLINDTLARLFDLKISHLDSALAEIYARDLGFPSIEEGRQAKPSTPFRIYHIRLDQLRAYGAQTNPKADMRELLRELLIDTHSFVFPLTTTANGITQVRSAATVVAIGKDYQISKLESSDMVHELTAARLEANNRHPDKACSCFAIWIPALTRYFLGDITTTPTMIKILEDGPGTLKKGAWLQVEQFLGELSHEAQSARYDVPKNLRIKKQPVQKQMGGDR